MRSTAKLLCASLYAVASLLAQGPPPGGGGPQGRGPGGPGPGGFGGPPVTGAPYSATRTETRQETLTDGNQIQETHTATIYRDTDGRTRMDATMKTPAGDTRTMITIFDPVAGFVAHLNPTDSTAMKETLPAPRTGAAPTQPPGDANPPEMVKTDLGTSTVAGLAATGTRTTITIPAGTMGNTQALVETREVWVSTALKVPVKVTSSDPRHGTATMLLSNISQTSPDPSLFQIPASFTVKEAPAHRGPGGPPPADGGSR